MKKLIIALLIVVVGCSAVFAETLSMGFSQGLVNTSFVTTYEWEHFGVQGDVGFPLIFTTIGAVGAIADKASGEAEDGDASILDFILPGANVGAYWKAVNGKHFGWNLGLGGSFQSYFMNKKFRLLGFATVTSGLNYKFNDRFSIGLDTSIPLALLLSPISEEAAGATFFFYTEGEGEVGDIFAILIGASYYLINEAARLSFKWTV